jgi:putative lipoprotein
MRLGTLLSLSFCGLALCGLACKPQELDISRSATEPEPMKVTGTLMKRDRKALPPTVVAEIRLLDVSKADAPAEELALQRIENPGQLPIAFELEYDPEAIDARHSYAVRAKVLMGEQLLYVTDTQYPVLTRGAGNEVELMLVPVRR